MSGTIVKMVEPDDASTPIVDSRPRQVSPRRHSRLAEKAELQSLNDRFAVYIDRVRNLEIENSRLSLELQSSRETTSREVTNIKSLYEQELNDARRLVDATSHEKAKLEIDTKRLWEENIDLKERLDKKSEELTLAENAARVHESRFNELATKYNAMVGDCTKLVEQAEGLKTDLAHLRIMYDEQRKSLEDETLTRVDLENTIQSLREELSFKDQVHCQELTESRSRRVSDLSEIDGRLAEQYEAKLQQSLQELRDQYESQILANRDEIEQLYDTKIQNLQNAVQRNSNLAASANEALRDARAKIDSIMSNIRELETQNLALNTRIRELEQALDDERSRHSKEAAEFEAELSRLRGEMNRHLLEYQDLMDIKVSLDLELSAYDKLLKGEESRLNITTNPTSSVVASPNNLGQSVIRTPSRPKSFKRKRSAVLPSDSDDHSTVNTSAIGDVEISKVDPDGKYVQLHNKGTDKADIGLSQVVGKFDAKEVIFKFSRSATIEPSAFITIWSAGVETKHDPPTNIVMRSKTWFAGEMVKIILLDRDGQEMARREQKGRQPADSSADGNGREGDDKCRLM